MRTYFFTATSKEENDFITLIKGTDKHYSQIFLREGTLIMFPTVGKQRFDTWNNIHSESLDFEGIKREVLRFNLIGKGVIRK